MRVLVACEFSGVVRDAFAAKGHDAWSCDLLPTERPGNHIQGDVLEVIGCQSWDLMIAHPPCTHLSISGARFWKQKQADGRQRQGVGFFMALASSIVPRIAIENPIGVMSAMYRKPDQIVQPFWFGDRAQKATCLWLKGLPKLSPTNMVDRGQIYTDPKGRSHGGVHTMRATLNLSPMGIPTMPGERWKIRSRTFPGIADAMAEQWGNL
jgi:site-specific DNA-cytosine methylase